MDEIPKVFGDASADLRESQAKVNESVNANDRHELHVSDSNGLRFEHGSGHGNGCVHPGHRVASVILAQARWKWKTYMVVMSPHGKHTKQIDT